ncbi:MAG: exo-beta-N-acetylmuramidase NamZ domain-containing protein, partial [Candidatus Eremiobacterota bacterium]
MNTRTGIDVLKEDKFSILKGYRAGLLINPASVDRELNHIIDLIFEEKDTTISALFGPQHGLYGNTQDNMIEWEGFIHPYY